VTGCRATKAGSAPVSEEGNESHQQLLVLVELDVFDDCLLDPKQGSP
jgi:hypothetical protein